MNAVLQGLEDAFDHVPMPVLEVWGRLAFSLGLVLAIAAFGGFTFRPGGRWRLGRERVSWDTTAVLSMPLTFVLIVGAGYLGSFVVLVPGAQTLESLKDLVVFVCVTLFGYPALVTVPFAYGLSDMIEGVPPSFILSWLPGYFINPACFWIAYQLFGKDPDFRRPATWGRYLVFVLLFLAIEPVLWGHICAGDFTPAVSYRKISSALFFTTGLTWIVAPAAMLVALPLARRLGLFWAEIPGRVRERQLGRSTWSWESGVGLTSDRPAAPLSTAVPMPLAIVAPFVALMLLSVGATAYVSLRSAQEGAEMMALRLQQETAARIEMALDAHLQGERGPAAAGRVGELLRGLHITDHGFAAVVDRDGPAVALSPPRQEPALAAARAHLGPGHGRDLDSGASFRFDVVSQTSLSRETWLAHAQAYRDPGAGSSSWIVLTAMPESYYLAGIRTGNSRSAITFALALLLTILLAALLAAAVTRGLRRVSIATHAVAKGDLAQRVPGSRLEEISILARAFNDMAAKLADSFDRLSAEVKQRSAAERALTELNASLEKRVTERTEELRAALVRAESADRIKSAFLATMSHELRTPLNSIIGFTGLILQGLTGPLNPEQARQLGMVRSSARHLLDLINDVLDLSKIEAGQFEIRAEPFDLREAIARAAGVVAPLAEKKGLVLVTTVPPDLGPMTSDRRRVEQILINLLNNAIKFTEAGRVTLSVDRVSDVRATSGASPRAGVRISVRDTGIGIRAEDLATLFQPFRQLDVGITRQHEGTGLGLAICRRIAEKLEGDISVVSEWSKGSEFTVALPLSVTVV